MGITQRLKKQNNISGFFAVQLLKFSRSAIKHKDKTRKNQASTWFLFNTIGALQQFIISTD
ncbi:hypothetical protein P5E72_24170, partial [Vibrio parahaemolyticus]|nr:hypothetical protein [Vibrio parahaemolyticus]